MSDKTLWAHVSGAEAVNGARGRAWRFEGGTYYQDVTEDYVPARQAHLDLLAGMDPYVGHKGECSVLSGAPDCDCGFDEFYTRVRAAVRRASRDSEAPS